MMRQHQFIYKDKQSRNSVILLTEYHAVKFVYENPYTNRKSQHAREKPYVSALFLLVKFAHFAKGKTSLSAG